MNFLILFIESILDFVKRNPLTVMIFIMLLVFAPSLFGAMVVGILVAILILMLIPIFFLYRMRRLSRKMEEQMRDQARQNQQGGFGGFSNFGRGERGGFTDFTGFGGRGSQGGGFGSQRGFAGNGNSSRKHPNEGEVKVYSTSSQQKRVSDDVGDYVDYEEVKSNDKKS